LQVLHSEAGTVLRIDQLGEAQVALDAASGFIATSPLHLITRPSTRAKYLRLRKRADEIGMSMLSGQPDTETLLDFHESELLVETLRWFVRHSDRWPEGFTDQFLVMLHFIENETGSTRAA